jgi:hypothetical protein
VKEVSLPQEGTAEMVKKEYYNHLDFLCNQYVYTFYSMLDDQMYTLTNKVIYIIEPNADKRNIYFDYQKLSMVKLKYVILRGSTTWN